MCFEIFDFKEFRIYFWWESETRVSCVSVGLVRKGDVYLSGGGVCRVLGVLVTVGVGIY